MTTNTNTHNLVNSTTKVLRAAYVPLNPATDIPIPSSASSKSRYAQQLRLQNGEVAAVRKSRGTGNAALANIPSDAKLWALLRQFEGIALVSQLPAPSEFIAIADSDLIAFCSGLVAIRQQVVQRLQNAAAVPRVSDNKVTDANASAAVSAQALGFAYSLLNSVQITMKGLTSSITVSPLGMLNLERLEMTPAGIERGGLIATIPLAPKERTFVVQKEWSVTSQEFTSIVTDSLDNYSETGVTENTQLAQSTTSQVAHGNQYNVTASVSGGIGFVSGSGSTTFSGQDQNSQSANNSRRDSIKTTRLASARVRQSHKTSISTTTVTGTSEATTRKLENPSATDPMRIDYFSLMRKWYVALYRYGLRLTYDITVPEPGATLRKTYAQLQVLQNAANTQFSFLLKHSDITASNYLGLLDQYGVDVAPPPEPNVIVQVGPVYFSTTPAVRPASFSVPDGYWISKIIATNYIGQGSGDPFVVLGGGGPFTGNDLGIDVCAGNGYLWHQSGKQSITLGWQTSSEDPGEMFYNVYCVPTDTAMANWQSAVWSALYNAAQSAFYARQQSVNGQIKTLQDQLNNVDTLTLRREENDEIMKCVLRWLLGPSFEFMPPAVQAAYMAAANAAAGGNAAREAGELMYGVNFTGNRSGITPAEWSTLSGNEAIVNFINQAIEWENVVFFTYSYFWDEPFCWDFIRQIQHPDKTRQAFLRAGSARVVLTVRQGWETAWVNFVENFQTKLPNPLPSHPYMTIAQQVAAYDSTNYPGIPAANPDGGGLVDDDTPQFGTVCAMALAASPTSPVIIPVADSSGFVVGATAIIDNWNAGVAPSSGIGPGGLGIGAQETQTITAVGTVPPSITVKGLQYSHSVASGPFPVVQAGAKGVLIGEWFEYTPTSGTDIAVTSDLATIA